MTDPNLRADRPNFAFYYAGDAYSTATKIMGRQSAGKALMKGVARRWPNSELHGFGSHRRDGTAMLNQLQTDGFRGTLRWRQSPGDGALEQLGAVYYPAPIVADLAHARNTRGPGSYSLFGITHTLSSAAAMDSVSTLVLPPFKPWDALICTSQVALSVVTRLQTEAKDWFSAHTGATRFNAVALPVIPLGVDAPAFTRTPAQITRARDALGLASDEVAFLFAGRLAFHGKANPAIFYSAVEAAAAETGQRIVCIEAGVFPNDEIANAFAQARESLAPSVRFLTVDGASGQAYDDAWKAPDVFVSLSDNVQETFGLTPLEAMAAGIPVLVSDWNGYKDTVRDGVDGYRIPVVMPAAGDGADLALRHALEIDSYDMYIGRLSMAAAIDPVALTRRVVDLTRDASLRAAMGAAGRARALVEFDWPHILDRYVELAHMLSKSRPAVGRPEAWPARPDPFTLFANYPTHALNDRWSVHADIGRRSALDDYMSLQVSKYVLDDTVLPSVLIVEMFTIAARGDHSVASLLDACGGSRVMRVRALMWLLKLGLIRVDAGGL